MMTKEAVKEYWDNKPCGTRGVPYPVGSFAYFEAIAERRDRLEWFISEYAQFDKWKGKEVLEVGCGTGSDLLRFAQAGAYVTGIDLSPKSVFLARERLRLYGCEGVAIEADGESIPYKDNSFDLIYSWGVLHHTPNTESVIREIYRVTKSGGKICVMLYNRRSLVDLQVWILFGLLRAKPLRSISSILANYTESLGTKAYTVDEVREMFAIFRDLEIKTQVTPYDLRYGRDKYLPWWLRRFVPQRLGWYIIVQGRKP